VVAAGVVVAVGVEAEVWVGVAAEDGVAAEAIMVMAVAISATAGADTSARIIDRGATGVIATHEQTNRNQVRRSVRRT
jgi:hypothetical protein